MSIKFDKKVVMAVIVTAIVAGGAGFVIGGKINRGGFEKGMNGGFGGRNGAGIPSGFNRGGENTGRAQGQGGGMMKNGGGFIGGEIVSKDDKSITVKLPDNSSKVILMSDNTKVSEMTDTSKDTLVTGKSITVIGTINNDGSVTATSIQVRPKTEGALAPQK